MQVSVMEMRSRLDSVMPRAAGRVQLSYAPDGTRDPSFWVPHTPVVHNQVLFEWGTIVQNLLRGSPDGKNYSINALYMEFDNSGAQVNPVPIINRDEGMSYYDALSGNRDFLRIPVIATGEETTDPVLFPQNNVAVFYYQSEGTVGVKNGLTFSDTSNSRVYGGALVAARSADRKQDLILSRFYVAGTQQVVKVVGKQIAVTWKVRLL
jgi:hypothetical protein